MQDNLVLLLADVRQALFDEVKADSNAASALRYEAGRAIGLMGRAIDVVEAQAEALKTLLGGKCPECKGWGEVAYFGETVPCRCHGKYRHVPTDDQIAKARAALALVSEASDV